MPISTQHPSRAASLIVSLWLLAFACTGCSTAAQPADTKVDPIDTGSQAEWITLDPARAGLDATKLAAARSYGFQEEFYTQAILVIRHGYLVAEWYADDSGPPALTNSWSIGKSFTATLVGMAIEEGLIESVDVPLADYIPAWQGTDKADITLHDALAMSSGLDWIEDYEQLDAAEGTSDMFDMVLGTDPMQIVLDQPVRDPAGSAWYYSSGDTMLLGLVLRQATGKTAADLVQAKLAAPLNLQDIHWWQDGHGNTYTFCCVDAPARAFAKFGQLYLQQGLWGGKQLVSAAWIKAAVSSQAKANPGYGFQWWLNHPDSADGNWPSLPADAYFALGHNGQYVAVFPSQDMVVVRMGEYIVPETSDWVARKGLFSAGVFSDNIGTTGTRGPEGDWSEDHFFKLFLDAIVE